MTLETYYRMRAPDYDLFYAAPERQADLVELKSWLVPRIRNHVVLEVAAGTGYWTAIARHYAKSIVATDYNQEMIEIAAKRELGPQVTLQVADAYCLPDFGIRFDVGMAHMWWSHVSKPRRREFLRHFVAHLTPNAAILMIDQNFVKGSCSAVSGWDKWGNALTIRSLSNGDYFEIIKNYPSRNDFSIDFSEVCDRIEVLQLKHFWALSAHVR